MIYHSIFHPHLSYGCSIWASNFIPCCKRIQIIQIKAIAIISPLQHSDNINLHFKLTKIFDVSKTRDFQITIFCFKCFNNLFPSSCENLFTLNQDLHTYETRNSCHIVHETPSTKRAPFLIRFFAPAIWNLIPQIPNSWFSGFPAWKSRTQMTLLPSREQ